MKAGVTRTFLFVALPAALVMVAIVFGGMELRRFLASSPKFAVRKLEVITKGAADSEELIRLAGVAPGTNIFDVDLEEVRQRVERDPWVYSASVSRALPNRIQITYQSQKPEAILGADSMYYLNADGKPFYRVRSGDSLAYPLVQVEGKGKTSEALRGRVANSVQILKRFKSSPVFHEKDLGDMTVHPEAEEGSAPYQLSLRFPPKNLVGKNQASSRLYTVTLGDEDIEHQVKRWEAVVRHLVQASKKPRLIRLELGKKVVVKVEK